MPDLSFHEESGSLPTSQDPRSETVRPQESAAIHDAEVAERIFKFETLSPEHRLLLSLVRPEEQRYFAESAKHNTGESLSVLARILTREHDRRKRRKLLLIGSALLLGIGGICLALQHWQDVYAVPFSQCGMVVALPLLVALLNYHPESRLEKAALAYLLQCDDPQTVGLLLEQRHLVSLADRKRVQEVLTQRLMQMSPEDASQLTPSQRSQLYGILEYTTRDRDIELRLAAIDALNWIGGRDALGVLYLFAGIEAATKGEQAVRAAAQEALHALQGRLDFGQPTDIPNYLSSLYLPANNQTSLEMIHADSLYALISLLPKLTPANYRQILSQADRNRLYAHLTQATMDSYGYDRLKLYREIVRTLERVGDTGSMNTLYRITVMEAPTDGEQQLRTAAKEALRALRQLVEKEKVSKTLLRASNAPDTEPNELLRPSAPAESATDPNELLRASISQQEHGPITAASLAKAMEALRRQSEVDEGH